MKKPLFLLAVLAFAPGVFAAEIQGAARALERINAAIAAPAPAAAPANPATLFRERVRAFRDAAAKLAPDAAVEQWLALVDAYLALPNSIRYAQDESDPDNRDYGFGALLGALPPPADWDALAAALAKRSVTPKNGFGEHGLRLLVATLRGDQAAGDRAIAALAELKPGENFRAAQVKGDLKRIRQLRMGEFDPKQIVEQIEKQIAALERRAKPDESEDNPFANYGPYRSGGGLTIPDLVTFARPEKAKDLLRRALLLEGGLSVPVGDETRKLAAKLALENVAKLKKAPWSLVHGLDDLALFAALDKRFPFVESPSDGARQTAEVVYLLGLIAANRTADATKFALAVADHGWNRCGATLSGEAFATLLRAGRTPALFTFLKALLGDHPELPYWDSFIEVAAQTGQSAEAVAAVRAALARDGLAAPARHRLRGFHAAALLANDEVDEAVTLIRALLAEKPEDAQAPRKLDPQATGAIEKVLGPLGNLPPGVHGRFNSSDYDDPLEPRRIFALQLARLGKLLAHPEWIDEGLHAAHDALPARSPEHDYTPRGALRDYAAVCVETGHAAEAEEVLIQSLVEITPPKPGAMHDDSEWPEQLTELARFYERAGRPQDVLALLDQSPKWGARDVSELLADGGEFSRTEKPLGFIAAAALAATGHAAEARRIVEAMLPEHAGADALYELWFKLGGDDLPKRLDALFALDRFEERPLIWKAQALLDAGQLEDAEKTARAAIAIDPSDGEQGKGDRLRAYAVLAAVLEKRGDAAQAKTLRGAVEAIRISENADDFAAAGLLTRAVKMYEDALTHFADAYCIQSRLAIRFAELGQMDKAAEHYQRAYELMPESFGRVESHCFGCERAFTGARAQGIAEKVFAKLAVEMPQKAQVFYLLGYLRAEQDRHPEALAQYRQAVQLDADYLNAWKKIGELGGRMTLPRADREAVALNLFRLDPQGFHGGGVSQLEAVRDFRALWTSAAATLRPAPPTPAELYPLAASKAELVKLAATPGADNDRHSIHRSFRSSDHFASPGEVLHRHDLIRMIAEIIEAGARAD